MHVDREGTDRDPADRYSAACKNMGCRVGEACDGAVDESGVQWTPKSRNKVDATTFMQDRRREETDVTFIERDVHALLINQRAADRVRLTVGFVNLPLTVLKMLDDEEWTGNGGRSEIRGRGRESEFERTTRHEWTAEMLNRKSTTFPRTGLSVPENPSWRI